MSEDIWIIGAGPMAVEYAAVLADMHLQHTIVGRSPISSDRFENLPFRRVVSGGVAASIEQFSVPSKAIVAVGVESLASVCEQLIAVGVQDILLEKPAGLNSTDIRRLAACADKNNAKIMVGYNRRFYAAVIAAKKLIEIDGGLVSIHFEFTEWSHVIKKLQKAKGVKERWVLANSSHVIDLAFHLCGLPEHWAPFFGGSLDWHPSSARFAGAGITNKNILFSYRADWESAGRWGIELLTKKRQLLLRPLEELSVVERGSLTPIQMDLEGVELDRKFKPGLYKQTEKFLAQDYRDTCSINEQVEFAEICFKIAGYKSHK